jgi:hypothetical protein
MPEGETGERVAGVGVAPGTGDGGDVFVGVVGIGMVVEGCGCCFGFEVEKMAAVTAEPAKAEAAAMRARVVLDMVDGVRGIRLGIARNGHEVALIARKAGRDWLMKRRALWINMREWTQPATASMH